MPKMKKSSSMKVPKVKGMNIKGGKYVTRSASVKRFK